MAETGKKRGFFAHIHPPRVTRFVLRFRTTWGLGTLLCGLFVVLSGSGVLLATVYEPALSSAYDSVWEITNVYPHGRLIRSVHYMAGNIFAIVSVLHFMRVVHAGAYTSEKYRNYLFGLALFMAGSGALASGYFLPMAETGYWALAVGLSFLEYIPGVGRVIKGLLMGGQTLSDATLVRLYVLHVVVLPMAMLGLVLLHLWRVRKDQGLFKPEVLMIEDLETVSYQAAVTREKTIFLTACLVLLLSAVCFPLGMEPRPVAAYPPNPVKAAWFFIALQETLSYSVVWGGLVPMAVLIGLLIWGPRLAGNTNGRPMPGRRRVFFGATLMILFLYGLFTLAGLYCRGPNWTFVKPWKSIKNVIQMVSENEMP